LKANGKITEAPIYFADLVAIMAGMGGSFTFSVENQGFFFFIAIIIRKYHHNYLSKYNSESKI
jgi:hypothetical protein